VKLRRFQCVLFALLLLVAAAYLAGALALALREDAIAVLKTAPERQLTVAIFGASGTAGDGILQAVLADPAIDTIHVITRRTTPRIEDGIAAGEVRMTARGPTAGFTLIFRCASSRNGSA
jgi:hypothetical protein